MQVKSAGNYMRHLLQWWFVSTFALVGSSTLATGRDLKTIDDVVRWHQRVLVTSNDLDKEVKAFLKGKDELVHPGLVKADLDGDGKPDVVLLTTDRKGDEAYLRIYICKELCVLKKAQLVGLRGEVFLQTVAAGATVEQAKALPGPPKAVLLKNIGVRVVNFGKAGTVYYWDPHSKSIHSITTAD